MQRIMNGALVALGNFTSGVRYRHVSLYKYKKIDLGVNVIRFDRDGTCRAVGIDFETNVSDDVRSKSACFKVPFWCGIYTGEDGVELLQHPIGWLWRMGPKRLTYNAALKDYNLYRRKRRMIGGVSAVRNNTI